MALIIAAFITLPSPFKEVKSNDVVLAQPVEQQIQQEVKQEPPAPVIEPSKQFDPNDRSTWPVCASDEIVRADNGQCAKKPAAPAPVAQASGSCEDWMTQAGISNVAARELIRRESGCRSNAVNKDSGACGIAQELLEPNQRAQQWASVNAGVCPKSQCSMSDPVCQLVWMKNYVAGRYGSWEAAIVHHNQKNWY